MDDTETDERFLSHGMREFASALPLVFAVYRDETGLGKEDDPGLGL